MARSMCGGSQPSPQSRYGGAARRGRTTSGAPGSTAEWMATGARSALASAQASPTPSWQPAPSSRPSGTPNETERSGPRTSPAAPTGRSGGAAPPDPTTNGKPSSAGGPVEEVALSARAAGHPPRIRLPRWPPPSPSNGTAPRTVLSYRVKCQPAPAGWFGGNAPAARTTSGRARWTTGSGATPGAPSALGAECRPARHSPR